MELLILLKNWKLITIGILAMLLTVFVALWHDRGNQIDAIIADYELKATQAELEYNKQARAIQLQGQTNVINAINEAKKREQVIIADANSARDAVNSLSNTVDELAAAARADAEFRDRYSATAGDLLKECSGQYISMAETADRIANDLRLIQQAGKR